MKHEKEGQLGEECCVCFGEKAFDDGIVHCDCKCHKSSEEKKDWEEEMSEGEMAQVWYRIKENETEILKDFIREKLKEERERCEEQRDRLVASAVEAERKRIIEEIEDMDWSVERSDIVSNLKEKV